MPEIVKIKGVGPVLAKACVSKGYGSVEKIAGAMVVELVAVPGVSEIRAEQLISAARSLLNGASPPIAVVAMENKVEAETPSSEAETPPGEAETLPAEAAKPKKSKGSKKKDKKSKTKKATKNKSKNKNKSKKNKKKSKKKT